MSELTREEAFVALSRTRPAWPGWSPVGLLATIGVGAACIYAFEGDPNPARGPAVLLLALLACSLLVGWGRTRAQRWSRRLAIPVHVSRVIVQDVTRLSGEHVGASVIVLCSDGTRVRLSTGDPVVGLQKGDALWCTPIDAGIPVRAVYRGRGVGVQVLEPDMGAMIEWDPNWRERL